MLKKLALAFAALGLATSMPAAAEARPNVSFELRIGNGHPQEFNRYRNYKHYPRCNRWEVAVRHPHKYNRYICVDRNDYRQYWRGDRYEPRRDRDRHDRQWRY